MILFNKKFFILLFVLVVCLCGLAGCNNEENIDGTEIYSESLTVDLENHTISGIFPNNTTSIKFNEIITVANGATYYLCTDALGENVILTKTAVLSDGDNTYYIIVENGDKIVTYSVILRVKPLYVVNFNTKGGTQIDSQHVEENELVNIPTVEPTKMGYTFAGWDFDFNKPLFSDITIMAKWIANTDTPYKVEYYIENIDGTYEKQAGATEFFTGTTDTAATIPMKDAPEHFFLNRAKSGNVNINGDGSSILKVYFSRMIYNVTITADAGVKLNKTYKLDVFKYGTVLEITAEVNIGYVWQGWYEDGEPLADVSSIMVDRTINYSAKSVVKEEMENFSFTSTTEECVISGVKDKTITELIVPDYVTKVNRGAFCGCCFLQKMSIPFSVYIVTTQNFTYEYPFGNVFGITSYDGGMPTKQYYYGGVTTDKTFIVYYIPTSLKEVKVTGNYISSQLDHFFYNCTDLTSIIIQDNVVLIGYSAFYNCTNLTHLTLPDSVITIGSYAFQDCNSLTSITIPDSVKVINEGAFQGCSALTYIIVPNSITKIWKGAFQDCSSLMNVYFNGTANEWSNISINNSNNTSLINAALYFYSETKPIDDGKFWHYDENGEIIEW